MNYYWKPWGRLALSIVLLAALLVGVGSSVQAGDFRGEDNVVIGADEVIDDDAPSGYKDATNNEMELMACIKALEGAYIHEKIDSVDRVYIFTDSMYVKDHLNRAIYEWPKQKWMNRHGRPIENGVLWKELPVIPSRTPMSNVTTARCDTAG